MDAIRATTWYTSESKRFFWVVEGDISSYFDTICHRKLVKIIRRRIKDGKIIRHIDHFDFYRWARQAFGIIGLLLGWTPFLKARVRKEALKNLKQYIDNRKANKGL